MKTAEFLQTVVTGKEGYFCLATRDKDLWRELWYQWPNDLENILHVANAHANAAGTASTAGASSDVYFSSHLFSEASSKKQYVLPGRTIQADLDHADLGTVPVLPTILVRTSPGRHQGYWVTDKLQPPDKLEALGRRIAYGVPDCDKTGWPAGRKVRLPNTFNYKYKNPHLVEVSSIAIRSLNLDVFNMFPECMLPVHKAEEDVEWVEAEPEHIAVPPMELLAALKGHINPKAYASFIKPAKDRSVALWMLNCELFKAGCTRDHVYHVAANNPNNKFDDRRYSATQDLRKDILRAENFVASKQVDLKAMIMDLRYNKGTLVAVQRQRMADAVINYMRERGEFIHTKGGDLYYLRRDTGRPVQISMASEWLLSYLGQVFGLNSTQPEQRYIIYELITYTRSLPPSNNLQSLSFFDTYRNTLLIHTGGRDVWHISASTIEVHPNGYGNVIFNWGIIGEIATYDPEFKEPINPWWELLLKDCLHNLIGIDRSEALIIMRAWFLFLLFRSVATTKPILALFGQPGASKTTTAKIFYNLLYGRHKSLSGLSNSEDFDMNTASMPFVAFDGCDTWQPWFGDRLSLAAGNTSIDKRKLWTDADVVTVERQALIAVTAHNPRFAREDITDRLILLLFKRLEEFKSETDILDRVTELRNDLWNSIILDVQRVLCAPKPSLSEIPQFRIEDFARLGAWFSKAINQDTLSTFNTAVQKVQSRQRNFNMEEDFTLVAAINKTLEKRPESFNDTYFPISTLWTHFITHAPDPDSFKKQYRNVQTLSRKLWTLQDSLKTIFDIDYQESAGTRQWRIRARG